MLSVDQRLPESFEFSRLTLPVNIPAAAGLITAGQHFISKVPSKFITHE
jgi:hypothetical protein